MKICRNVVIQPQPKRPSAIVPLLPTHGEAPKSKSVSRNATNTSLKYDGDRISVLQSPREVMKRLEVLKGIMFSGNNISTAASNCGGTTTNSSPRLQQLHANQAPALRRSRKPHGKHLPPLHDDSNCDYQSIHGSQHYDERSGYRINSFY